MNGTQEKQKLESAQNATALTGIKKKCSGCKKEKTIDDFGHNKSRSDGHRAYCYECERKAGRIKYKENADILKGKSLVRYYKNHEKNKLISREWRKNNPEKFKNSCKKWRKKNVEKTRISHNKLCILLRKTIKGNLDSRMSSSISHSLRNNKGGRAWEKLIGYTVNDLKKHIEKGFKEGMTWEKFINGEIHIDHKVPKSAFNYKNPEDEDFQRCWGLKNLQPLWARDNIQKSNKLDKHFQPGLIFQ